MKLLAILFVTAAGLTAQTAVNATHRPSPFGSQTQTGHAPDQQAEDSGGDRAEDPYASDLGKALGAERDWKRLDMSLNARLEGAGACTAEPVNLINAAAAARVRSLAFFGDYYRKHESRWRDAVNYSVNTAGDRAPDRSEILSAINTLRREKADLERRQRGLAVSLAGQDGPEARKSSEDLAAMIERKSGQLERSEETLRLFDSAQDYLRQRREFARMRLREIAELIEDIKAESLLWEHLYRGVLHSWELRCDKSIPAPTHHDDKYWQTKRGN